MFSRIVSTLRWRATEPSLKRLRNRLLIVNLISLALVVAVAFSLIYVYYYNRTQSELDKQLESIPPGVFDNIMLSQQLVAAAEAAANPDDDTITISGGPLISVDYSKSFVININSDGTITVFSMLDIKDTDYVYAVKTVLEKDSSSGELNMAGRVWQYNMKDAAELRQAGVMTSYKSSIVFLDVEDAMRGIRELAVSLLLFGLLAIAGILLVSLLVANRAIQPVEESMFRQRRFVADASHELKTPIAVIAANAEAAKDAVFRIESPAFEDGENVTGVTRWIDNISDEAIHMDALIKNLLALARADEAKINAAPFDLYDAIRAEAERVEAFLYEKNIVFVFEPPPQTGSLTVCSDRAKTQAILSVLFENAVKYTSDGGRVSITAGNTEDNKKSKNSAWVAVSNTGEYIPPEDIKQVFDRFYRADRSRSSETGGHGIGLSIAMEIVRTLKGELTAESKLTLDGTAVNTFTLYI